MTERFALTWAIGCAALLFGTFFLDMIFELRILRWMPGAGAAFALGAIHAAIMLGPIFWITFHRNRCR
jgi:hypothetical protein